MADERGPDQHHRSEDISPIAFGRLVALVEVLTVEVAALRTQVGLLQGQMSGGKGMMAGIMLVAGGTGAGVAHLFEKIFK